MSLRPLYALVLLCTLAELGGCQGLLKKKDPEPAPSATVAVTAPPAVIAPLPTPTAVPTPTAAPVAAALDETAVPAPQDFEDEAFTTVTPANFKAQFATLKAAISK
jgi:hypothetical protein